MLRNPSIRWPRHCLQALIVGWVLCAFPTAAFPQESRESDVAASERDGLWFGLGAGTGWDRLSCDICSGDRLSGLSGFLQVGGTLSPELLLGGELKFWNRGERDVDQLLGAFSVVAVWYPNPARPLQLKGGFGYLALHADDGEDTLGTTSFGPQIGVGYDFSVGRGLSLTPYLNLMVTPFGDLTFNDTRVRGGVRTSLLQVGLALTQY